MIDLDKIRKSYSEFSTEKLLRISEKINELNPDIQQLLKAELKLRDDFKDVLTKKENQKEELKKKTNSKHIKKLVSESQISESLKFIEEQIDSGTIIPEFYNCLNQYVSWDEGLYEDYFSQLEILVNGISHPIVTYGHYQETDSSDFETIENLFTFLNNKK